MEEHCDDGMTNNYLNPKSWVKKSNFTLDTYDLKIFVNHFFQFNPDLGIRY